MTRRARGSGSLTLEIERAVDVGSRILRQGRSHVGALVAKGDRDFATAVDFQVEDAVKTALRAIAPEIPFLGEEYGGEAIDGRAIWVLDPIDGTVNFARGSPLCGISLALVEERRPRIAVVDFPFLGERYLAVEGAGAFLIGATIMLSNLPWDVSGGVLLVREAGGAVCDLDGAPHTPASRCTVACARGLTDAVLALVAAVPEARAYVAQSDPAGHAG